MFRVAGIIKKSTRMIKLEFKISYKILLDTRKKNYCFYFRLYIFQEMYTHRSKRVNINMNMSNMYQIKNKQK